MGTNFSLSVFPFRFRLFSCLALELQCPRVTLYASVVYGIMHACMYGRELGRETQIRGKLSPMERKPSIMKSMDGPREGKVGSER